jgi:hypothetical protein
LAPKTHDTSGRLSQPELLSCDQVPAFLKTSKDIAALGFPTCCKTWQDWVTERRGAWRARVNAARLTKERGSLFWPSVVASEVRQGFQDRSRGMKGSQESLTTAVVKDAANWPTPNCMDVITPTRDLTQMESKGHWGKSMNTGKLSEMVNYGQAAPASSSSLGSRQGLWLTPRANEPDSDPNFAARNADRGAHCHGTLSSQAKSEEFPTPRTTDWKSTANAPSNPQRVEDGTATLGEFVHAKQWATPRSGKTTDENPETWALRQAKGDVATMPLGAQVKAWATPKASDPQHSGPNMRDSAGNYALPAQAVREQWGTPTARDHKSGRGNNEREYKELTPMVERQQSGKLNPRWVETLMGLPIGWTMPSCTSPQTIAPMSCDSSATELSRPPQSEPSEFSLAS